MQAYHIKTSEIFKKYIILKKGRGKIYLTYRGAKETIISDFVKNKKTKRE